MIAYIGERMKQPKYKHLTITSTELHHDPHMNADYEGAYESRITNKAVTTSEVPWKCPTGASGDRKMSSTSARGSAEPLHQLASRLQARGGGYSIGRDSAPPCPLTGMSDAPAVMEPRLQF